MKNLLFFSILLITPILFSQNGGGFGNSKNWSLNKHEIYFSVGTSQFLGDLGGLNKQGSQNSLVDLDFSSTRIGGGIGYRFRFHPRWATSTQIHLGLVSGADSNTDEVIRRSRNLSFRSPIIELSQRLEFIIFSIEDGGSRYSRLGSRGRSTKADFFYIFSGISGFYFNPQTKIDESWTNLRPLRTEGQGLPGGKEEYGRLSFAIPIGIGFRVAFSKFWRIGLETSYNKTFTDYIDDVSTEYFNPSVLAETGGKNAVYAGNPSIENHTWFTEGQQRGNSEDNDAYLFTSITITRNVTYKKTRGMSRSKWNGKAKF